MTCNGNPRHDWQDHGIDVRHVPSDANTPQAGHFREVRVLVCTRCGKDKTKHYRPEDSQ